MFQQRPAVFSRIVTSFIAFVCIAMFCWFVFLGVIIYKASDAVSTIGVSGVLQQMWCGAKTDCSLPVLTK